MNCIKGISFANLVSVLHKVAVKLLQNQKLTDKLKDSEWKRLWILSVMYKMKEKTKTVIVTDASVYSNQHVQFRTHFSATAFNLLATKAIQFEQVLTQFQDLTYLYGAVKPLFSLDDLQFCSKMLKTQFGLFRALRYVVWLCHGHMRHLCVQTFEFYSRSDGLPDGAGQ